MTQRRFSYSLLRFALCGALLAVFSLFIASHSNAQAGTASLVLGPTTGTFTVGNTFTVSLYVNTGGAFINAVEAYLEFPPDKLQVVSPTTDTKSFIQIWSSPPQFSNRQGTISFQGGVQPPGINAENAVVATVSFRVKDTGIAAVRIRDTSRVFLADGTGTNVLGNIGSAIFTLALPPPAGPTVTSPTHPDQGKWSGQNDVVLRWERGPDTEGFSYALSSSPIEEPDNISEGTPVATVYEKWPDGLYYFHIKSLRDGVWGGVTHYAIRIDKTPPADFKINVSPKNYTSNRDPIITFGTTDEVSGVDHYELKLLHLNPESPKGDESPFFIEVTSPYTERLNFGKYEAIVRSFDRAGNFTQSSARIQIQNRIFQFIRNEGLQIGGAFTLSWWIVIPVALLALLIILYVLRGLWILHRKIEVHLGAGAAKQPEIMEKLRVLKEKQSEYKGEPTNALPAILLFVIGASLFLSPWNASAQGAAISPLTINPPVVTLFPETISNDEILYIGGQTSIPEGEVIVNLQRIDTGSTFTKAVQPDKRGAWLYIFPEFLAPGEYQVWTQLKFREQVSTPSPQITISVAPTVIQLGNRRVSFQQLYLALLIVFASAFLFLLLLSLYHWRSLRVKRTRLAKEIREAEESLQRGFSVLRRDIESELSLLRSVKLNKEVSAEEQRREEKLLKDLEEIRTYIGKEIWEIGEVEKTL